MSLLVTIYSFNYLKQADDTVDEEAIANYCMMYSVFLVPDNYLVIGLFIKLILNVTNPRVFALVTHAGTSLYNSYYLWVSFFLIIQVIPQILFYLHSKI